MEAMYLLLPLSLVLVAIVIVVLIWAANSGQFDDLEAPGERLLMDDDQVRPGPGDSPRDVGER